MICPRCSVEVPGDASDCPSCGVVFSKWRAGGTPPASRPPKPPSQPFVPGIVSGPPKEAPPEFVGITHAGLKSAGAGFVAACLLTYFPFLSFILSPLTTMVHEIGHTAVLWLFGYPAVPAFDFANGGGVTMSDLERSSMIVAAWGLGAGLLGYWQRERKGVLIALAGLVILYLWSYNSTRETLAIALGGHGGEIAFGVLFLYRGLTGWGCKVEAERPIYAFLAFMILFSGIRLAMNLAGNSMEKYWYLQGKGGIDNDLVTGAQILSIRLESIGRLMLATEILAIPLAFGAAAARRTIGAVAEAEEE